MAIDRFDPKVRAERERQKQKEKKFDLPPGYQLPSAKIVGKRPPGTLLLNMLIKNERDHLDRTLPKWANIIDYWIVGVDDHNTDDSEEIIKKHLGHIPGEIVYVEFDGMGPTWSVLVKHGIEKYPQATHGILADADFMPMKDKLDKMELDIRCSKHMYTIWTQDHRNERKMDWIYRNIPGAVVRRRTHQILEVPELPDQEVFQTLIDLPVEEREGGWGDRSGENKNLKYIRWLEKDLAEYPGDTRTLYYLGYAHFDIYNQAKDGKLTQDHHDHLAKGVSYFKERAKNPDGNEEELWFALLKLGEIYERFYHDWNTAEKYYLNCSESDPDRADAWFYIGQHYRLRGEHEKALPYLYTAAKLPIPERSLFQWHYLYYCLSKLEYGRALTALSNQNKTVLKEALRLLNNANCAGGDVGNVGELQGLKDKIQLKIQTAASGGSGDPRVFAIRKLVTFFTKNIDQLEIALKKRFKGDISELSDIDLGDDRRPSVFNVVLKYIEKMQDFQQEVKSAKDKAAVSTCRNFRRASSPYLKFVKRQAETLKRLTDDDDLWEEWDQANTLLKGTCR